MASPWKFLARLTSRLGGSKERRDGLIDESKEAARLDPVEAAPDNTPNPNNRLVEGEPQPADQSDALVSVMEQSLEAGGSVQGIVDLESAKLGDAVDPALPDDANFIATSTHDALTFSPSKKRPSAKQKRSREASVIESVEGFPKLPTSAPTFPEAVQSLDEEIRRLRDQLARKLQLQNAHLRMIDRKSVV